MRGTGGASTFGTILIAALAGAALLTGCAVGSSQGGCAAQASEVEAAPERAAPDRPFTLRGENFIGRFVCDDTGPDGFGGNATRAFPARDVRLEFRQGGKTRKLGTVDAGRNLGFETRLEVPEDARPGRATVRAVGIGVPAETPFWVIDKPAAAPSGPKPPRATLSHGGKTEAGELGSYCWSHGCADATGFAVPPKKDALAVATGSGMTFDFGEKASSVEAEAVSLDAREVRLIRYPKGSSLLVPKGGRSRPETQNLRVCRSPARMLVDAGLPPGEYAIEVFARVPEGDASYYFRVRVEPEAKRKVAGGGTCGTGS